MKAPVLLAAVLFLVLSPGALRAEDRDPLRLLGMDLKTAIDSFGVPQSMFPYRGTAADRDDVVFYYPDHLYLFWFRDRVWMVRFDMRYTAPVLGLTLGMPREQIQGSFPRPLLPSGDSLYFDIDSEAYPVRVRLVFAGSRLSDVYVFRSDF